MPPLSFLRENGRSNQVILPSTAPAPEMPIGLQVPAALSEIEDNDNVNDNDNDAPPEPAAESPRTPRVASGPDPAAVEGQRLEAPAHGGAARSRRSPARRLVARTDDGRPGTEMSPRTVSRKRDQEGQGRRTPGACPSFIGR